MDGWPVSNGQNEQFFWLWHSGMKWPEFYLDNHKRNIPASILTIVFVLYFFKLCQFEVKLDQFGLLA